MRISLLLFGLLLPSVAAADPTPAPAPVSRLGTLIRWYLREDSPARREDTLEEIEKLVGGDYRKVVDAIRRGLHHRYPERPTLKRTGALPTFSERRPALADMSDSAGRCAELVLPKNFDPALKWRLAVELAPSNWGVLPPAPNTVVLRVYLARHAQASVKAWAAEALVLSLVAHIQQIVRINQQHIDLRADGKVASVAYYIAFQNPDRFGGLLASRGAWIGGTSIAKNAAWFTTLGISDPRLELFRSMRQFGARLDVLAVPTRLEDKTAARKKVEEWRRFSVRRDGVRALRLDASRPTPIRAYWLRAAPRPRAQHEIKVGRRWSATALKRPGTVQVKVEKDNLVDIKTRRIHNVVIFADPRLFDFKKPMRIRVNGRVPESHLIFPEVATLLEDYRKRRDPALLYPFRVSVSVRDR